MVEGYGQPIGNGGAKGETGKLGDWCSGNWGAVAGNLALPSGNFPQKRAKTKKKVTIFSSLALILDLHDHWHSIFFPSIIQD